MALASLFSSQMATLASGAGGTDRRENVAMGRRAFLVMNRTGCWVRLFDDSNNLVIKIPPYYEVRDNLDAPTRNLRFVVDASDPVLTSQDYPSTAWAMDYELYTVNVAPSRTPLIPQSISTSTNITGGTVNATITNASVTVGGSVSVTNSPTIKVSQSGTDNALQIIAVASGVQIGSVNGATAFGVGPNTGTQWAHAVGQAPTYYYGFYGSQTNFAANTVYQASLQTAYGPNGAAGPGVSGTNSTATNMGNNSYLILGHYTIACSLTGGTAGTPTLFRVDFGLQDQVHAENIWLISSYLCGIASSAGDFAFFVEGDIFGPFPLYLGNIVTGQAGTQTRLIYQASAAGGSANAVLAVSLNLGMA